MLKIYDQSHQFVGHIVKYKDCRIESDVATGDKALSFTYLAKYHVLKNEYYVRTKTDEYVIKEISENSGGCPQVVAMLNTEDLQGKSWQSFSVEDTTIDAAARLALAGTGWTVGECGVTKRRNASMPRVTSLTVIQNLCTVFMCEPVFDTLAKTVSFYEKRGEDRGSYFLSGLNLRKLSKQSDSNGFFTQIIPLGKDGLTINEVNGGRNYLENHQYSDKVIQYIWQDESYTDPQALKDDAEAYLSDKSKPAVFYSADVIDLAAQNPAYSVLSYRLGDTVRLIDSATGTREAQRIVRMTEYPQEPEKNTCEIANTFLTFEELQEKLEAAAALVGDTMTSDGKIHVSDILGWEKGLSENPLVSGMQDSIESLGGQVSGLSGQVSTLAGQMGALSMTVGSLEANCLTAEQADIKYASIEHLNAVEVTVHSIQGDYADFRSVVTDELAAQTAIINELKAGSITAEQADIKYASIEHLNAVEATVHSIQGDYADFRNVVTDELTAQTAIINELKAGSITVDYLNANYAQIDLANIREGCITTAMIGTGVVQSAQIADGAITNLKVAGDLDAAKITVGTLSVDRLVIRGATKSLVYELNNIEGALQSKSVDTLNGEIITPRTITADRIVARSITGDEIKAQTITANNIAANTITAAEIKAGTITAVEINVADLFAQDITAEGKIRGAELIGVSITTSSQLKGILTVKDGAILSQAYSSPSYQAEMVQGRLDLYAKSDGNEKYYQTSIQGDRIVMINGSAAWASFNSKTRSMRIESSAALELSGTIETYQGHTVTSQQIGYLSGVTSNIQTQLDDKAALSHTHGEYLPISGGAMSGDITYNEEHGPKWSTGASITSTGRTLFFKTCFNGSRIAFATENGSIWSLYPVKDEEIYLGLPNERWSAIYATTGAIQTSDARRKNSVVPISERYETVFNQLRPVSYRFNGGRRIHTGFISQDIEQAMGRAGLTAMDWAAFCRDDDKDGGHIYGLRYEEIIALNTHMIQKLTHRDTQLERRVAQLECRVAQLECRVVQLEGQFRRYQAA